MLHTGLIYGQEEEQPGADVLAVQGTSTIDVHVSKGFMGIRDHPEAQAVQ